MSSVTHTMMDAGVMADEEEREFWRARYWEAVTDRDSRMDGMFFYAVLTTGVYCRPSCPSRRPKRVNVLFFGKRDAAEHAGFRPCRRCHPQREGALDPQAAMVEKVCRYIDANLDAPVTLTRISREVGLSPFHLQRTFKALLGITPRGYADARRLESLKSGLQEGHSVTQSMYDAGYGSSSRLYERSTSQLGMTPSRYRKQGSGETIQFTIAASPIGRMLLAATGKGVCSIRFSGSDGDLEKQLRAEFSQAEIKRDDSTLAPWVESLLGRINGAGDRPLPLDIRATAFQRMVWEHLQKIPYGRTESYSQVAKQIGRPKASRAVARACAANPVAVAIPCHRVIREDGNLGGYRWGDGRKKTLLAIEHKRP
jgi:AraC family transcriptional regulator of adaptative response/methylated-DNA-[protein]-cysteine methyltransferase